MDLFCAIDLRDGRCVRLHQGNFAAETEYATDPVTVARGFEAEGASWIHVVDLDAARTGIPGNRAEIAAIADAVGVPVQVGGGIRDAVAVEELCGLGVTRVVMGTGAIEDPALVIALASSYRIAIGIDARGDDVAVRGWAERTGVSPLELISQFSDSGVDALVVTEIARDGTMIGPDVDGLTKVLAAASCDVIASGGVGALEDLAALSDLRVGGRTLAGVIIGRALYEGVFGVTEALGVIRSGVA